MDNRKKSISFLIILFLGLWFFFGRNFTFAIECRIAEFGLQQNFENNQKEFFEFASYLEGTKSIQFSTYAKDSLYMSFRDSAYWDLYSIPTDVYTIRSETQTTYHFNNNGCLELIGKDTAEVVNPNWEILFYGHYQDPRIEYLLAYYGWESKSFHQLVEKVQNLNCMGFVKDGQKFKLNYEFISFYKGGKFHCFGHEDGYFDYLFTQHPDSFYWQKSLKEYEGDYYGIEYWNF